MKSFLTITACFRNGKNILKECYHTHPFKAADITEDKSGGELKMMIMTSSPGVLNNDDSEVKINIEENSTLHVYTQAFQRLYEMKDGASQQMHVELAEHSTLFYIPHPLVPQQGCDYFSESNIHLQSNHHLLWSEIITCGRKESGESFQYKKFHNITNIYINEKLVLRENILLQPKRRSLNIIGHLEDYTHQSTLLWINDKVEIDEIIGMCREVLGKQTGISFGVSKLPVNGLVVRMLAQKGEQLFTIHKTIAKLLENYAKHGFSIPL